MMTNQAQVHIYLGYQPGKWDVHENVELSHRQWTGLGDMGRQPHCYGGLLFPPEPWPPATTFSHLASSCLTKRSQSEGVVLPGARRAVGLDP